MKHYLYFRQWMFPYFFWWGTGALPVSAHVEKQKFRAVAASSRINEQLNCADWQIGGYGPKVFDSQSSCSRSQKWQLWHRYTGHVPHPKDCSLITFNTSSFFGLPTTQIKCWQLRRQNKPIPSAVAMIYYIRIRELRTVFAALSPNVKRRDKHWGMATLKCCQKLWLSSTCQVSYSQYLIYNGKLHHCSDMFSGHVIFDITTWGRR